MHYWNDYQRAGEVGRTIRSYWFQAWSRQVSFARVVQGGVRLLWTSPRTESPFPVLAVYSCISLLLTSNAVASLSLIDWPFSLQHRTALHLSYIFVSLCGWSVFSTGGKRRVWKGAAHPLLAEGSLPCLAEIKAALSLQREWKLGLVFGGDPSAPASCGGCTSGWVWTGTVDTEAGRGETVVWEHRTDQQQEKTWGLVAEGVGVGMEVFYIILTRMRLYPGKRCVLEIWCHDRTEEENWYLKEKGWSWG